MNGMQWNKCMEFVKSGQNGIRNRLINCSALDILVELRLVDSWDIFTNWNSLAGKRRTRNCLKLDHPFHLFQPKAVSLPWFVRQEISLVCVLSNVHMILVMPNSTEKGLRIRLLRLWRHNWSKGEMSRCVNRGLSLTISYSTVLVPRSRLLLP